MALFRLYSMPFHITKYLLLIAWLIFGSAGYAQQLTGKVVDAETGSPIPYARIYVLGTGEGRITDENGEFFMEELQQAENIAFRAACLGYETTDTVLTELPQTFVFAIPPKVVTLKEVKIQPRAYQTVFIGSLKNNGSRNSCGGTDYQFARLFPSSSHVKDGVVSGVKVSYQTDRDASFLIHLYEVDTSTQLPGKLLTSKPIEGLAYSNKSVTLVSFEKEGIEFPDSGIVVALEWRCEHQNEYKEKGWNSTHTAIKEDIKHFPVFNAYNGKQKEGLYFKKGRWAYYAINDKSSKFRVPSMELEVHTAK